MAAGARDVAPIAFAALVIGVSYGILAWAWSRRS